jgi:predicted nucleotidyltransferase
MQIRPGIEVDDSALAHFCQRHHIARLALHGSSLRGDFSAGSGVDVLVEFEAGHEVELRTYEDLSRFFRDEVRASARQLYAA